MVSSELFVVCYPTADGADHALKVIRRLQAAHLLHLEDCISVRRGDDGKLSIHRSHRRRLKNTALGMLAGAVLGKIVGTPLMGVGLGAVGGAMADGMPESAIDEGFVHELAQYLGPNSSAAFALVRRQRPDTVVSAPEKVLREVGQLGGTVLHTTLSDKDDERLQAAIDAEYNRALALRSMTLTPHAVSTTRVVAPQRPTRSPQSSLRP